MEKKNLLNIPISILELATITEGKTIQETFINSADLAKNAENWGYKRFWLAEHHNMVSVASSATSVLIGYIASATKSIRVGSGGIMLPNHAPLMVAEQFGTLGTIYPDRIDLGLGRAPGTDPVTARALRREMHAGDVFPSQLKELMTYFSPQNESGVVRAIPGEGVDIPIWILGSSTDSAYLAAEKGLPYAFASHFAPAQLILALKIYHQNFRPSQFLSKPHTMACINVIAADTDEEANFLATSFYQLAIGIITGQRNPLQPPVKTMEWSEYEKMAVNQMMEYSFIGSPDTVRKGLEQFVDFTRVNELMITSHIFDHEARLKSFEIVHNLM
jgi:luciferase family oxidoreductase group 1